MGSYTDADKKLLECLPNEAERMRQNIARGKPYVWELRLSLDDFCTLESAIDSSISSHAGDYHHLLSEDFAVLVVIYLAEWYKRFYKGADTMDENKVLALTTQELKQLYTLAGIDQNTFVYNASKNPDKTSFRWLESLQVLGGLAVQAELKRDSTDALLPQLCRIFHGEELDLDDIKDHGRAVAFQESIARQHSLYDYLDCILDKDKEPPFSKSDMRDENTMIPQFIKRIENADRQARRDKFDFEWVVFYTASRNQMVRHLRVKLKPEVIGGGRKQYLGYDRMRDNWGIEHPERIGHVEFYLRFKLGNVYVHKEGKNDEPLLKYHNTSSERTGFLSINKIDENTYTQVPSKRFDKVEMVMKYDGNTRTVQTLDVKDYMQVYAIPKTSNKFSTRKNAQAATAVIFSSAYHLADGYLDLPVVYAHYRNSEDISEDYCWCPINDKVVIADQEGHELLPPFFNRNGLYQVVTRKYLKTIKYRDNVFVLYKYIDADYDDEEMQEDSLPVLFGRNGLEVRHFANNQDKEGMPVADYDLEWLKGGRYTDWNKEEPEQGAIRLRVTIKGIVFKTQVYYVPFTPSTSDQPPIWRDFERMRICTALDGIEDIQDDFKKLLDKREPDTLPLTIGNEKAQILVDVYRPVILHELSQKRSGDVEPKIVGYSGKEEQIRIPLINCEQFSLRDFSENGVKEYQIQKRSTVYYNFPTFNQTGLSVSNYLMEEAASALTPEIPLDFLKIYISKAEDKLYDLYAWDYKSDPKPVNSPDELTVEGIVFQSLKDNDSPRHYSMPTIKKGKGGWGGKKNQLIVDPLYCFETIAEHKTYFFLFNPLIKTVASRRQVEDILLPLIEKRNYELTETDIDELYRFAVQFHFDWMLLPREDWQTKIETVAYGDEERRTKLTQSVTDFFSRTPKCTDEREKTCLEDFLKIYWTFDSYPSMDNIAQTALKLIKNDPDALVKYEMKDFLKLYDECRFKFSEMSRSVVSTNEDKEPHRYEAEV